MEIQVGKAYWTRQRDSVSVIIRFEKGNGAYPLTANNFIFRDTVVRFNMSPTYTSLGSYVRLSNIGSQLDLVSELTDEEFALFMATAALCDVNIEEPDRFKDTRDADDMLGAHHEYSGR
jgi:hypothetical protein